jgi:hypothetical protein
MLYLILRLTGWMVLLLFTRSSASTDAKLPALRHEVAVLRRQNPSRSWTGRLRSDRRPDPLLPRPPRMSRLVTPDTLPRWHWRLIRWRWAYHSGVAGRQRTPDSGADRAGGESDLSLGYRRSHGGLQLPGLGASERRCPDPGQRERLRCRGLPRPGAAGRGARSPPRTPRGPWRAARGPRRRRPRHRRRWSSPGTWQPSRG